MYSELHHRLARGTDVFARYSGIFVPCWIWLDAAEKTGTVKVMQDKDELAQIQKQKEMTAQISVLHTPQFWTYTGSQDGEWRAVSGEDKKNEGEKEQNGKMNDIGHCNGSDCK